LVWPRDSVVKVRVVIFNFLYGTPHFSLHILVVYFKSFSKHYNKIFFYYFLSTFQVIRLESYNIADISITQVWPTAKISWMLFKDIDKHLLRWRGCLSYFYFYAFKVLQAVISQSTHNSEKYFMWSIVDFASF